MTATELEALFLEIGTPQLGRLAARPLVIGAGRYRIAKQDNGAATFLILVDDFGAPPDGEQLANVDYIPRARVRIECVNRVEDLVFSVLTCRSADAELRNYFFRVVSAIIDELGEAPTVSAIDASLCRLLELFRALERPSQKSVQGLWGELLVICLSADPKLAVSAWHANPGAIHDFSGGSDRLEVKSTLKPVRQHHFRLEQLGTPAGGALIVASLMLVRTDDGTSVSDLLERLQALLPTDTEHRSRVESVVAASLGVDWRQTSKVRFDEVSARGSLRFIAREQVPSITCNIPIEVSDVRFLSDLSGVSDCKTDIRGSSTLFHALLPMGEFA